ncbi:MAG: hypothetical protein AB1529_04515 [Candidatus Micrarchaeota archaeon]
MKSYQRTLLIGAVAVGLAAGTGALFKSSSLPRVEPIAAEVMPRASEAASKEILSCKSVKELGERLPAISRHLKAMRESGDAQGLRKTYEATKEHVLALMERTRVQEDSAYIDDIHRLGGLFIATDSRDERLALIFLALPRLHERVIFIEPLEPDGNTIERAMLHAEDSFFNSLGDGGFGEASILIRRHWYTPDQLPPDEQDKRLFFEGFARLR